MLSTLNTRDLIISLKEIKVARNLTPQKIFDMLELAGYHVSLNSIKKVFEDGSEDKHFNFHRTLQPISQVLLGIYGARSGDAEADALRADIRVKAELIEKLEREIAENKTDSHRRMEFLTHQIELKDQRIDRLMTRVDGVLETNREILASNRELMAQMQKLIEKLGK